MTRAEALSATARQPLMAGLLFDFDGTLAAIQQDPERVEPVPGAVPALARLAPVVARLAIVSARPVRVLAAHFAGVPGLALHGLYGLERLRPGGPVEVDPAAAAWRPAVREAAALAAQELPAGTRVEDKGLSVALHYRGRSDLRPVIDTWARGTASRLGLRAQEGRMVVELRPPLDTDKGTIAAEEAAGLRCAWYFGDDLGDVPAFEALTRRAAADPGFTPVRVAVTNPETGSALASAADLVLESPAEVPPLLDELADLIARQDG